MLYNPNWTKADPLTLEALIAWLETKPADEVYCYMDLGRCLAAQYNASIGRQYYLNGFADSLNKAKSITSASPFDWQLEDIARRQPYTFGAALSRARAMLAKQEA